jgi:hypothetical protein
MGHFSYCGKEVRRITKLFKNMRIKIFFHTQNTIQNILKPHIQTKDYNRSGIYQMKCLDCPLKYTGQTGRTFIVRYKEHIHAIRNNSTNSRHLKPHITHRAYVRNHNIYYGYHKSRKEGQTFKFHRKILHL